MQYVARELHKRKEAQLEINGAKRYESVFEAPSRFEPQLEALKFLGTYDEKENVTEAIWQHK